MVRGDEGGVSGLPFSVVVVLSWSSEAFLTLYVSTSDLRLIVEDSSIGVYLSHRVILCGIVERAPRTSVCERENGDN